MTVYYTLPNGEKLSIFFWDDYYTGKKAFHTPVEVAEIDIKNGDGFTYKKVKSIKYPGEMVALQHELKLYTNEEGRHYILWKGIQVYLEDFDYYPIKKVISEIEHGKEIDDRWYIDDNMILASLMKQPEKFGVLLKPRVVQFFLPGTNLGIIGDQSEEEIIYIPKIEKCREPENWYYKIKLHAKDEKLREITGTEDFYFSDFCSMLKSGYLTLVEL